MKKPSESMVHSSVQSSKSGFVVSRLWLCRLVLGVHGSSQTLCQLGGGGGGGGVSVGKGVPIVLGGCAIGMHLFKYVAGTFSYYY